MPDAATDSRDRAARASAYLMEVSPEMRGCAIASARGEILATSGEVAEWEGPVREMLEAVDRAGDGPASHAHVATGDGEVYVVREGDLIALAVTDRFVLASLVLFDLRVGLRDLAAEAR